MVSKHEKQQCLAMRKYTLSTVCQLTIFCTDCGPVLVFRVGWIGNWNEHCLATKMASREEHFQNVFRHSNIKERKKVLAKVLQFSELNEDDDLRTAALIDVYYEVLSYLVNNGFPWREVASFFEMFQSLLNETQGKQQIATDRHINRNSTRHKEPSRKYKLAVHGNSFIPPLVQVCLLQRSAISAKCGLL